MHDMQSGAGVATAPPPPSEVKIRTMKSDLASMTASGGGMPRYENVKVAGLTAEQPETASNIARTASRSNLLLIVVLLVFLAALVVVGWFIYLRFQG